MKRIFKRVSGLVALLVVATGVQAGPAYYSFLEIPVQSAVVGMGSAGTSLARGGSNFYNPAGLSFADKSFVTFDFTRIYDDLGRAYIESGWVFPQWYFGAAFQTQQDEIQVADETGIREGAYEYNRASQASLLLGLKRERFGLGISINGVHEAIGDYKSYGFSGSIGLIVALIPKHIYLGISGIHAAGRHTTFLDPKEKLKTERFPATVRGGLSWVDTLMQRFPVTLSADVVYNDNDELVTVPIGIDFNLLPPLSIRIGKRFNHPTEIFSMGLGLKWKNIAFDAAFVPSKFVTDIQVKRSFALTYYLASPKKKAENKKTVQSSEAVKSTPVQVPVSFTIDSGKVQKDTVTANVKSTDSIPAMQEEKKATPVDTQVNTQKPAEIPAPVIKADSTVQKIDSVKIEKAPVDSVKAGVEIQKIPTATNNVLGVSDTAKAVLVDISKTVVIPDSGKSKVPADSTGSASKK